MNDILAHASSWAQLAEPYRKEIAKFLLHIRRIYLFFISVAKICLTNLIFDLFIYLFIHFLLLVFFWLIRL